MIRLLFGSMLFLSTSILFAEIRFVDHTNSAAILSSCTANGGAFGDYNGDGMPDLFIACLDRDIGSKLFENRGNGTFENRSALVKGVGAAMGGLFVDIDQDGDRDLYAIRCGPGRRACLRIGTACVLTDRDDERHGAGPARPAEIRTSTADYV